MKTFTADILNELLKETDNLLLTKKETAKLLGVSTTTIDNYMNRKVNPLSFIKYGKGSQSPVRFHITSIATFLANNINGVENEEK